MSFVVELPNIEIPAEFQPQARHIRALDRFYVQMENASVVERTLPNGLIVLHANHDPAERIVGFGIRRWSQFPFDTYQSP